MKNSVKIAIGLVHYPTLDREKKVVATNITNFDIHDIARAARTYGVSQYYIIHPAREQLMFVERVQDHWRTGYGSKFNPSRSKALEPVRTMESVEKAWEHWNESLKDDGFVELEAKQKIFNEQTALRSFGLKMGQPRSLLVTTSARQIEGVPATTFKNLRERILEDKTPCLLLFGTGYGMTPELIQGTDVLVEPIKGVLESGFNHLSVRSAVSICLDRLLGS